MATGLPSNVPLPQKLELSGNIAKNWKIWRQLWESFETLTKLDEQDSKFRKATLITCIGPEAVEIIQGLPFKDDADREKNRCYHTTVREVLHWGDKCNL